MKVTFADEEGRSHIIITSRGIPVSETFTESDKADAVLNFLMACGVEDNDVDHPQYAAYPLLINNVKVGFRTELTKKMVWLSAQPGWKLIVDALGLTLYDITIYEDPDIGETLAIKRRPAHA
jgi:hypothetical protein